MTVSQTGACIEYFCTSAYRPRAPYNRVISHIEPVRAHLYYAELASFWFALSSGRHNRFVHGKSDTRNLPFLLLAARQIYRVRA